MYRKPPDNASHGGPRQDPPATNRQRWFLRRRGLLRKDMTRGEAGKAVRQIKAAEEEGPPVFRVASPVDGTPDPDARPRCPSGVGLCQLPECSPRPGVSPCQFRERQALTEQA